MKPYIPLFLFLILVSSHGSSDVLLRFLTKIKIKTKMLTAKSFFFGRRKKTDKLLLKGFI